MTSFGPNLGYVDELLEQYRRDPDSVSPVWREFFEGSAAPAPASAPGSAPAVETVATAPEPAAAAPAAVPAPAPAAAPAGSNGDVELLRGVAGRIVENMVASLSVPTATSARTIPVKALEENRRLINLHQAHVMRGKVSFTHLVGFAVVRALVKHSAMSASFGERDGAPARIRPKAINLGIAIDLEKKGQRQLVVPNVKDAGGMGFLQFFRAYEELVVKARQGKLDVGDFAGTTVTITNPGMIGTELSVPRLMVGQGLIVGVGSISYPTEFSGMAPEVISELGLSKVMTMTSTYDHRIIQGAESGAFLATVEKLLRGEEGFYAEVFRELGVPHSPVAFTVDQKPRLLGGGGGEEANEKQANVVQLIRVYRVRGHLLASLDPLEMHPPAAHPDLDLANFGLTVWDLDRRFVALLGAAREHRTLREIYDTLRDTYCRHIGVEYMHIADPHVRLWLQEKMERTRNSEPLGADVQKRILLKLNAAEAFERFLHGTFVGHKRFSLEGAETLVPMLDYLFNDGVALGIEEAVIGMAHRGRLNVLANVIGKSYAQIFREFEGNVDPESTMGSGDVKYHVGATGTHTAPDGRTMKLSVAPNPSHLEAVNPVVEGMVRARQDRLGDRERARVLPVLIHGDAAYSGQGVVAETLNLSQVRGFRTGGTVHVVVNNQIGFTTRPEASRSSHYATDVAKMVHAPIFHVNGDQPEDAVRVIRLALAFRQALQRDVVVDLVCYRRWGHNEGDDPSYTNPTLYARIESHRSVRKLYTEQLLRRGDIDPATAEGMLEDYRARLEETLEAERQLRSEQQAAARPDREAALGEAGAAVPTGAAPELLAETMAGLDRVPEGFQIHPKLEKQLAKRRERFEEGHVDWAVAEALAFGSLALQGIPVRISGQDSRRGTFSHRHAALYDYQSGKHVIPLSNLRDDQAPFRIYDTTLSEMAVMGFEYGFSVEWPAGLVMWEAQFGDFVNGAQIIVDQFLTSAEDKWRQKSGLVLLLPHGYEGQGPEHSSARLERFLTLCAGGNLQVAQPTLPAQYFHLLRRQVMREARKPLVVLTPKSLLRHPEVVSGVAELSAGAFEEVLDDPRRPAPPDVTRVILTSGKLFYDLDAERRRSGRSDVAIVRLEQYYPFPGDELRTLLSRYIRTADVVWAQDEPRNMGAWNFLSDRLRKVVAFGATLSYAGRPPSPSPATGSQRVHAAEQAALVAQALGQPPVPVAPPATADAAAPTA